MTEYRIKKFLILVPVNYQEYISIIIKSILTT